VITNARGDRHAVLYVDTTLNVTVPVKMIFAAFASDEGTITSPVYRIKTAARFPVKVSLARFDAMGQDGVTLTQEADDDLSTGQFNLKLKGAEGDGFTAAADTGWIGTANVGLPGGVLGTFGEPGYSPAPDENQCDFEITGRYEYGDDFPVTAATPKYAAVFKFELVIPPG
jgi:hypothetical protein